MAIVGDVVGHGPKAARLATFVRERLAALAASTSDPAELLTLANTALAERPKRGRQLVSAACVRYGPGESEIAWASAGHPPPLALPRLEEMPMAGSTFLLGARPEIELTSASGRLGRDEGVLVYTDGATDVRRAGSLLGLAGLGACLPRSPACRRGRWLAVPSGRSSSGPIRRSATTSACSCSGPAPRRRRRALARRPAPAAGRR